MFAAEQMCEHVNILLSFSLLNCRVYYNTAGSCGFAVLIPWWIEYLTISIIIKYLTIKLCGIKTNETIMSQ